VLLTVGGTAVVTWHCTPTDLSALATGWLVSEGIATGPDDLLELRVSGDAQAGFEVGVGLTGEAEERLWGAVAAEGRAGEWPAGHTDRGPGANTRPTPSEDLRQLLEDRETIAALFQDMFAQATVRSTVGGVHTGGLVRGRSLHAVVEDVSRHHVVDRLVGRSWLDGSGPEGTLQLLSSRISGAMARKACRAGVAALVSRSIPSELAASLAADCGLVLVGRARGEARYIHWPT
jgi:FdhD protein